MDAKLEDVGEAAGGTCPDGPRTEACSYTCLQELVDNLPYIAMILLGSAILIATLGASPDEGQVPSDGSYRSWRGVALAGGYLAYGVAGAFWIMIFVCPHCHFHGTRSCPCGYGRIAGKLRSKKDEAFFRRQFRRHIPVIVPLWLIPPVAGGIMLWRERAALLGAAGAGATGGRAWLVWLVIALVAAFVLDSVVVLPLVSRKYGCAHCPQKADCPWMGGGGGASP